MKLTNLLDKPIIAVVSFNLFTLGIFMTAPVEWDTNNRTVLSFFVLVCQLLILIGFQLGRKKGFLAPHTKAVGSLGNQATNNFFAFYGCTFLIGYAFRMNFSIFDIAGMFSLLLTGILDRQLGYVMALRGTGLGPIPWTVFAITSIFNQVFFIVGFVQWKTLNFISRLLFVCFVCVELFFSIGRGTSFGVVALVTTFYLSTLLWTKGVKASGSNTVRHALLVAILLTGTVVVFAYNLYSRSNNVERKGLQLAEFANSPLITGHPALSILPEALLPSYLNVISYLAGGYFHTCLAFDLDFQSTWGLGSNPALIDLGSAAGIDVWEDTYVFRLQSKGVDPLAYWHSAYTWFASDVSFYGVPFVMFALGYLFGFSWATAVKGDFLSKIVFVIFGNMLLFLFANNTYLSTVFYSFMILLPIWLVTRYPWIERAVSGPSTHSTVAHSHVTPMLVRAEQARR